jgi:DNA-binding transcriptional ArsR family regulator
MGKKSFLLVSLKEKKAKELAQVISNDSCRKILDYLSDMQDATESDISEKLKLPISTVHYNLQHLMKAGIVDVDEFHYSEKGKEVNHYKLANKYIIIAPKTTYGLKEKLKAILPVSLLALVGAGFIQMYTKYFRGPVFSSAKMAAPAVMEQAEASVAELVMDTATNEGARAVVEKAPEVVTSVVSAAPNYALWFLFGCVFIIVLVVIFELIKAKRSN